MTVLFHLFRQDPAFRAIPKILPASLAVGLMFRATPTMRATLANQPLTEAPGGFSLLFLMLLACLIVWTITGNSWTRSSRMGLALPLSPRQLWGVRFSSLVLLSWVPIIGLVIPLAPHFSLSLGTWSLHPLVVSAAFRAASTMVLLMILLQLPWLHLAKIPIGPEYIVYGFLVTVPTLSIASAGVTRTWATVLFAGSAFALACWVFQSLPSSFETAPRQPSDPTSPVALSFSDDPVGAGTTDVKKGSWTTRLLLPITILRTLHWNGLTILVLLGSCGFAIVATVEFSEGRIIFLAPVLILAWTLQVFQQGLGRTGPLDPLPIPRPALFAYLALPVVFAVLIGVGAGVLLRSPASQLRISDGAVEPPWDSFEIVSINPGPQEITSPWGETINPTVTPLWRGSGHGLINPYESDQSSSTRFQEWQLDRAKTSVFGTSVDTQNQDDATSFQARATLPRARTAATTIILFTAIGTTVLALFLLQFCRSRDRTIFKWLATGFIIAIGAIFFLAVILDLAGWTELWRLGVAISVLTRQTAQWSGLSSGHLWSLAIALCCLGYLILQRLFSKIEMPGRKIIQPFAEEY
ncbi:MAG: hypothetical protein DRJ61_10280 [Acidobacteria bacterium]|nr:MAG: hypothetical protein DRJ61_10280 [Acidobacteriota bacterium]